MRRSYVVLAIMFAVGIAAVAIAARPSSPLNELVNWGLTATVLAVLAIVAFFFEFERRALGSKEVALVAMLGTISAVLRVAFAAVPNVQPCTFLIICSGYVFGPVAGFMVGSTTALVSNFFLGQGPWTPYQMLAWGLVGVSAALLRRFRPGTLGLVLFGVLSGYLYGWMVSAWYWASFTYPLTFRTFIAYQLTGVWLDTFHAAGNALFLWLFGMKTVKILERFRRRFNWRLSGQAAGDAGI